MPKEPPAFFDVEQIISDVEILKKGVRFRKIQIQGGEPLLYKDLDKLLHYLRKSRVTSKIRLATNAIFKLKRAHIEMFKKYRVEIRMSDYNLKNQKINQIEEQCLENNIKCRIHRQVTEDQSWLDMGRGYHEDNKKVQMIYSTCLKNDCYTLIDGKFTKCSRALMGAEIDLHPDFPSDYIDVRKSQNIKKDLKDFLLNNKFMECCRYCNGSTGKSIPAGIQL